MEHIPQAGQGQGERGGPKVPFTTDFRWCSRLINQGLHLCFQGSERPRRPLLEAGRGKWAPQVECFFCSVQLKASL